MLAHHYLSALRYMPEHRARGDELVDSARVALREAGDRSLSLNAFAKAAEFYGEALTLWPPSAPGRDDLILELGRARLHSESGGGALLEEARDAFLAHGRPEKAAEAMVLIGELQWMEGDPTAFRTLEEAAALLQGAPASPAKAHVLSSLARFRTIGDENEKAIEVGLQALAMADELSITEVRAHALDSIGRARVRIGDPRGFENLEESISIAVDSNSLESVRGYANLGNALVEAGDLAACLRPLRGRPNGCPALRRRRPDPLVRGRARLRVLLARSLGRGRGSCERGRRRGRRRLPNRVRAGRPPRPRKDPSRPRRPRRGARGLLARARAGAARRLPRDARSRPGAACPHARGSRRPRGSGEPSGGAPLHLAGAVPCLLLARGSRLRAGRPRTPAAPAGWPPRAPRRPSKWLDAARAGAEGDYGRAADIYAVVGSLPDELLSRLGAVRKAAGLGLRAEAESGLAQLLPALERIGASRYAGEGELLRVALADSPS